MPTAKRGRLSSIDLLPERAEPIVAQAMRDLVKRRKPQTVILKELNAGLAVLGIGPISKSAFSRKAIWIMGYAHNVEQARDVATLLFSKLPTARDGGTRRLLH